MRKIISIFLLFCLVTAGFPAVAAATSLVRNGGFDTGTGGWNLSIHSTSTSVQTAVHRSSPNALKITTETTSTPYATQRIANVIPGATYKVNLFAKAEGGCNFGTKYEFYKSDNTPTGGTFSKSQIIVDTSTDWTAFSDTFTVPEGTDFMYLFLRIYAAGTVYVDDVEMTLVSAPVHIFSYETDEVFYYSDRTEDGTASVRLNTAYYTDLVGRKAKFAFIDGEEEVHTSLTTITDAALSYTFPMSYLEKKKTAYGVRLTVFKADGVTVDFTKDTEVYKYDRPKYIKSDGTYRAEGEDVFHPVLMYGVELSQLPALQLAGVNLVQGFAGNTWLDALHARGMKAMVVLYGSHSAGHPDRLETTKSYVEAYKDHPAVFGWAVQDEPNTEPETLENLKNAYKAIRDIDDNHPVWITANGHFDVISKYCDVMCNDSYPYNEKTFTTSPFERMTEAVGATDKPVYYLLQAFEFNDSFPNAQEIRNMIYQAFLAGGKGFGYYKYNGAKDGMILARTELWDPMVSFYENEMDFVFDAFVNEKYPVFKTCTEGDVWYRIWQCGDERIIAAVNRNYAETASVSFDMAGFSHAYVFGGTESGRIRIGDGTVTMRLAAGGAILGRIVPKAGAEPMLYNENWEPLKTVSAGQTVYAAVTPVEKARLMLCLYKTVDGKKILSAFNTIEGENELVTEIHVPQEDAAYEIKTMVWDGLVPAKGENNEI